MWLCPHIAVSQAPAAAAAEMVPPPLLRQRTLGPEELGQLIRREPSDSYVITDASIGGDAVQTWAQILRESGWLSDSEDEYEQEDVLTDSDSDSDADDDVIVPPRAG